ncbi:MAG TPA: Fic family protein [Saprospiraceae bacterium]|mgnify:CR=1 FL=1|nr:Fic family protein [Saprospiraceae bacterium]HUN16621.1 Fic family protein [Saprospiraceae bacterium]
MQIRDIKNFKAGNWVQRIEYKSFTPEKICLQWVLSDPNIQNLLSEADRLLGKLDAFSELIPDVDFFIKMHITKEATVSSKIEGTQTSFEEALIKVEEIDPEKRDDWIEVHNYINAINEAIVEMKLIPISNRLIKQTHKTLLQGARGKEKQPGEYRNSQNWIGSSLKHAVFIPPTHEELPELMHDLELFINSEIIDPPINIPHLIKIAIIHYQFETIHPFLDGNGRIGRLLITLYLLDKKILQQPTLYLSDFFERNRADYYQNLTQVREKNNLQQWFIFFFQGVIETAQKSIHTFQEIVKLRDEIELNKLLKLGRKQIDAKKLINALYRDPIMDGAQIAEALEVHSSTANRLIKDFEALGILREFTGYKRNRIYIFEPYVKLF